MGEHVIRIPCGQLRGRSAKNYDGKTFYSFQGIPYAKPPVGDLRFEPPQPVESWPVVRDATSEGPQCFGRLPVVGDFVGSEDCLYLNVYTPSIPTQSISAEELKPVMFFIHGGGFTSGSGNTDIYGPEYLLTEDIVLVTINYRLHILGFLSLHDPELGVPGNNGLKDIVMALKWVQNNISHFSGDPNNVTIFGESAGGAACHYLILSPKARGLFHKAILQSGCALNIWARGTRCAIEVGRALGLQTTDERQVLETLRALPIEQLYEAGEKLPDRFIASTIRPYGPVIERKSSEAFLCEEPLELLKTGRYNRVPIMIGYTSREGMLGEILQKPKSFKPLTDFQMAIPYFLKLERDSDISLTTAKLIKEFYYGSEEPSVDNKDSFYLLESDNFFIREILRSVKYHVYTSPTPVFLYRMSIDTALNMLKHIYGIKEPGACHADDIGYLFKNYLVPEVTANSREEIGLRRFVKLWANFARYSDPNSNGKCPIINTQWKPVTKSNVLYLNIGEDLVLHKDPEQQRMKFWDDIFRGYPTNKL